MSEGDDIRAQLARMEGKQDVMNERMETANRISEERHSTIRADILDLRQSHHRVSNRVQVLEADKHMREGERKGVIASGRIIWAGIGLIPGGAIVAALMKLLGH